MSVSTSVGMAVCPRVAASMCAFSKSFVSARCFARSAGVNAEMQWFIQVELSREEEKGRGRILDILAISSMNFARGLTGLIVASVFLGGTGSVCLGAGKVVVPELTFARECSNAIVPQALGIYSRISSL